MKKYNLYINGEWVMPETGKYEAVENPANEDIIGYVASASEREVEAALSAAENAQKKWEKTPFQEKGQYLLRAITLLQERKEHFAEILTKEQGKTYREALGEVEDTILYIKNAVEAASRIKGDILPASNSDDEVYIHKVPYGVVVALCAWNYPLALVGRKLGPALMTGNTVVLKPHELTPLATAEFFEIIDEVGFPKGVVNLITGNGAETGNKLVSSPKTRLVTVTGSVRAGQAIYRAASENIAGLTLELGGKAPFIVLEDADIEQAVDAAVVSRYANCGQICICSDMVFVQESVAKEFTTKLIERVKKIKVGDPFETSTMMGPKACKSDLEKIKGIVERTIQAGGKVALGGKRPQGKMFEKGFWYEPTVLTDVTMEMSAAKDEIFGPVLPIIKIKDFEDAVLKTNQSPYGLACYLFTNDANIIRRSVRELEVGTVFVNHSVGGEFHVYHNGHKQSGLNGEDGEYGIEDFLQKRAVYVKY